ncbi:hypothetical protein TNCT_662781 [Trichonephila clavata]|uniref:Uncharacterized protein n=1 Tax=Trichonephila clavata TaxID=2740835 RepID=A0A8X6HNP0_TRICU|nr:hypothetical protein TNCT_662781 [Trichonephila clavata]
MDKNSKIGKENHIFKRSPLKETKVLTSEAATKIVHLMTNEASDSSKLNVIFIGNENSELVKKILNFDTTDPNSQQLKMSKQPLILKYLPRNMFVKGVPTHKENISGSYTRRSQVESMLSTISKRIMYSVSDMSYHVLMKKVYTDFLFFQEICRRGTIKNDAYALHHEIASYFPSGLKKERNTSLEELNPPNAHSNVEKTIKTVHSNINEENVSAVNIMSLKFSENSRKYSYKA